MAADPVLVIAASEQDRAKQALRAGQIQPFEKIHRVIKRRYEGKLSDASLSEEHRAGKKSVWTYQVKWLTPKGNVLAIIVDAKTVKILKVTGRGAKAARKK